MLSLNNLPFKLVLTVSFFVALTNGHIDPQFSETDEKYIESSSEEALFEGISKEIEEILKENREIVENEFHSEESDDTDKEINDEDVQLNDFVIKLKREFSDDLVSDLFATTHSLEKVARINEFSKDDSLFHFKLKNSDMLNNKRRKRSIVKRFISNKIELLQNDDRVEFVVPQPKLKREKRDEKLDNEILSFVREFLDEYENSEKPKEDIKKPDAGTENDHDQESIYFNDSEFNKEWYLVNDGQLKTPPGFDMNVRDAWLKGFTGKNVSIVVIDDGLDHEHPDFAGKYRADLSYDFNDENDPKHDPMPSTFDNQNNHGTKCAGAAAANANNSLCGVGVAYDAQIAGLRILDGAITDIMEARALSYKAADVDIRSASWGPRDDGAHMEYPGKFVNIALEEGVKKGRKGKGTLYIWASGNGGVNDDDCSADGYVSNWNVISIGSVNHRGKMPYFMERCPSTMAVVHSGGATNLSGDRDDPKVRVVATDVRGKCTTTFQGTSSAAPLAAGAMALVIEANPNLTYRDVMYLIAKTAKIPNIEETDGWIINGANYHVNDKYGFGAIDVSQMVQEAQEWKNVDERYSCVVEYNGRYPKIPSEGKIQMTIDVSECPNVERLEHVVANVSFKYSLRGDVKLTLISPSNTPSEILSYRRNDYSSKGAKYFPFMTLFNWGESPIGKWTLIIESRTRTDREPNYGSMTFFALKFFGTTKNEQIQSRNLASENAKNDKSAYKPSFDEIKRIYIKEKGQSKNLHIERRRN